MGDKTFIEIPVLVNVLKGCPKDDPSDDQIKKWIKEANAILEDAADVHLKLDGITQDVGGTSCDINSLEDANKIEKAGRGELEKKYGKGKGYKIVVAGSLGWIEFAAGVTEHATDGTAPVSFIGRTKDGGELKKWSDKGRDEGQTIAHEFCHAVTLGPGHTIDKSTKADDKGHVPKKKQTDDEYKANLMRSGGRPQYRQLTDDQKKEVQKGAKKLGIAKQLGSDGLKTLRSTTTTWMRSAARSEESASSYFQRGSVYVDWASRAVFLAATIGKEAGGHAITTSEWLLNGSDSPPGGGSPVGARVRVRLSDASEVVVGDIGRSLPKPRRDPVVKIFDHHDAPTAVSTGESIVQRVPLSALPPIRSMLSVTVQALDVKDEVVDRIAFTLDPSAPRLPALAITRSIGSPAQRLHLSGKWFAPRSKVELTLGTRRVSQVTTDENGAFTGQIRMPAAPGRSRFLTANDEDDAFDFVIITSSRKRHPKRERERLRRR